MANTNDPADAAARLEVALERIAALAEHHIAAQAIVPAPETAADAAAVAERLDVLIATLREALARRPA